jgi:ribosomal protein S8E
MGKGNGRGDARVEALQEVGKGRRRSTGGRHRREHQRRQSRSGREERDRVVGERRGKRERIRWDGGYDEWVLH